MIRALIHRWQRWHSGSVWLRAPVKVFLFLALVILTLYPKVWLIPTWLGRERDLNSVLDPANPALAPLEAEARAALPESATSKQLLDTVENVVYRHVPYAWDWDVWGVVDYLPTVTEVFQMGREDCDGRAVVAASLLRRMGHEAWIVSDILHMWVETPQGETMSPTGGEKTLVGEPGGTKPHINWGIIDNLVRGNAYGIAVFPMGRELLLIAGLAFLRLHPRSNGWRSFSGLLLMLLALAIARGVGQQAALQHARASTVMFIGALLLFAAGGILIGIKVAIRRPDSVAAPPG